MKFLFIHVASFFCFNLFAQLDQNPIVDKWYEGAFLIEIGGDYLIPHGDFSNKLDKNPVGLNTAIYKQLYNGRYFVGLNFDLRRFYNYEIEEYIPDVDQQTVSSNFVSALSLRIYPEFLISIFEFWAEGGAGMNMAYTYTSNYDKIAEESFDSRTESIDLAPIVYGAAGLHIPIVDKLLMSIYAKSYFGTSIDFYKTLDDPGLPFSTFEAFELKSAVFRASSINISLAYLF